MDNYERVTTTTTRIITSNTKKIKNKNYYKNEIMTEGTLSIIKLQNRRINYSESEDEPVTLPSIFPNLLCNPPPA